MTRGREESGEAERMGGTLALEDSEGPGATFTLRLPGARAPEEDIVAFA